MSPLFAIALCLSAASPEQVQALVDAGRLEEATAALDALPESLRPRFEGLIALEQGAPERAVEAFERAIVAGDTRPELQLYLAHAYVLTARFPEAVVAAQAAASLADRVLAQPLVEARARRGAGDVSGAYEVLERAAAAFPTEARPRLEQVVLLSEAGLQGGARAVTRKILELDPEAVDVVTALALFHVLYADIEARQLLEALAARFPEDPEIRGHLGHAYAAAERHFAAGRLFEAASRLGGDYAFEAADQYRVAGRFAEAARSNAGVREPERRRRQRLSIAFDQRRYARVVALAGASDVPADIYRIAYAHYALGLHARAADLARGLRGTTYDAQAAGLLRAMGRSPEAR